jgi:signal transduction histidine kinase
MDNWSKTVPMKVGAPAVGIKGDEISALTARFAAMSSAIERQVTELKRTDEMRRELIANVSHDLRTPLASLRGYIETLLIKESNRSQEMTSHLEVALRQADQLGRLVDALFELARLESGTVAPRLEPISIAELLQDIAMRFCIAADRRGVALQTLLDLTGVMVMADVEQIERALGNLLENAIQHTPRGGQVRIEMASETDLVRIRVVDTGRGIAPEHLPRIFERFYSVRDRADRGHTGLGLAIVKRIIELHAQSVSILSKPGAGTTVEFTLQRTNAPPMVTALVRSA